MNVQNDVAIIGAGPYGLSVSAHLAARGVRHRIFGSQMHTWRCRMPEGMLLRSPGFGSDLSDPNGNFTLARYWAASGRPPEELHEPVPLDAYLDYARWFVDGTKVPVEEVEEHLRTHPGVRDAAVVAVPDRLMGEKTCAFVTGAGEPPALAELRRFLAGRGLADYKLPDRVEPIARLPLTGAGKVDRVALRAEAERRRPDRQAVRP